MAQEEAITETLLDKNIKNDSIPETSEENIHNIQTNYEKDDKSTENDELLDHSTKQATYDNPCTEIPLPAVEIEQTKSKPVKLKRKKLDECQRSTDSNDNQCHISKEDQKRKWNEHKNSRNRSVSSDNDDQHVVEKKNQSGRKSQSKTNTEVMKIGRGDISQKANVSPNQKKSKKHRTGTSPKHKSQSVSSDGSSDEDINEKHKTKKINSNRSQSSSSNSSSDSNKDKSRVRKETKRKRIEHGKDEPVSSSSESSSSSTEREQKRKRSDSSESTDSQKANRRWGKQTKTENNNEDRLETSHHRSHGSRNSKKSTSPNYRKVDQKYTNNQNKSHIPEYNRKSSPKDRKKEHQDSSHMDMETSEFQVKQSSIKEGKEQSSKITTRKLSLSSSRKSDRSNDDFERPQRKRKWGSSTKAVSKPSLSISTDSLKDLIPDYKPVVKNVAMSSEELTPTANTPDDDTLYGPQELIVQQPNMSGIPEIMETDQIKDNPSKDESPHPPTPPQNPVSCIIHVRNLVRPFTLQQLKQVLARTGTLVEGGFWIDKIKSKCYATYETEDQASETRQALHGTRWPPSNPKTLIVDFATKEELDYHKELPDVSKLQINKEKGDEKKSGVLVSNNTRKRDDEYEKRKDRQKDDRIMQHPIREWDRDKLTQDSPEHDRRTKDRIRERGRSPERKDRKEKKDTKRKQEEETPAKLLDDLFRKTKATPCIYWLPLTEEQIHQRDQERRQRQIEREKRRQQRDQEDRETEEAERLQRQKARESRSGKEKENSQQSRSPLGRKR